MIVCAVFITVCKTWQLSLKLYLPLRYNFDRQLLNFIMISYVRINSKAGDWLAVKSLSQVSCTLVVMMSFELLSAT